MRLFHSSDWHLSFSGDEPGKILKPMDTRTWSKGSPNYVEYLARLESDYKSMGPTWNDLLLITGDLTHDMSKKHLTAQLDYLSRYPGVKLLIEGNHDHQWDFGLLRSSIGWIAQGGFIFLESGAFTCYGPFLIGCYSDHRNAWGDGQGNQPAFSNPEAEVMRHVHHFVQAAKRYKKVPIMVSHYPLPVELASKVAKMGIRMYLSGHVHCTSNKVEGGTDWSWYNKSAKQTDDQVIDGCFFSTGTTDVLLNKHGKMIKEVTNRVPHQLKEPGPQQPRFRPPAVPAKQMIVLSGLPGAGKSTYAQKLKSYPLYADHVIISQDECGSRKAAVIACEQALSQGKSVIIDRVNFDASYQQRGVWVETAKKYKVKEIVAAQIETDKLVCMDRVVGRVGHPTLNAEIPDDRKRSIVERFSSQWQSPQLGEGFHFIALPEDLIPAS